MVQFAPIESNMRACFWGANQGELARKLSAALSSGAAKVVLVAFLNQCGALAWWHRGVKMMPMADTPSFPTSSPTALPALRVGEGWDTHALVTGRSLILGGVTIPHTHGLLGHSDADALLHAITDALLGAAALGDIGQHFPDTDPRFKGADSIVLLKEACARVGAAGWQLLNVDATIVAQAPKMAPHIPAMRQCIAGALGTGIDQVNVKAKTAEKMGPVGEGRAIEARAVCLLIKAPA
jgi:2-C-methyl-D-erythritol 2,4-cyclodiphosphate synthase